MIQCKRLNLVCLCMIGLQEHKTHNILCDFLEKHGFEVEHHYLLDTAFRATYRKGTGPHVAVLCEYDALPEIGHACGHNLIAEAGAGAGLAIKAAMAAAKENMGTVRVGVVWVKLRGHPDTWLLHFARLYSINCDKWWLRSIARSENVSWSPFSITSLTMLRLPQLR